MDRRLFILNAGLAGSGLVFGYRGPGTHELLGRFSPPAKDPPGVEPGTPFGSGIMLPDDGWRMWPDVTAEWRNDTIFLPDEFQLAKLPLNPPTGGWAALGVERGIELTLPATVEQFHWGLTGLRDYHDEYKFETTDSEVKNGAYYGVSWWWREIEIPSDFAGKRILLHVRSARQRAEVYLNQQLVGYSIMEELPFECDLTHAARPGGRNILAIRITNPGGRLDWVDGGKLTWGSFELQKSHGFGGLDRALMLSAHGPVRVADCWVLNTPVLTQIIAHAAMENTSTQKLHGRLRFAIMESGTDRPLATADLSAIVSPGEAITLKAPLSLSGAKLWDLDTPNLYRLRATWMPETSSAGIDTREVDFGFRWFSVDGLGANAIFRLNGRRIRIYTAISWGFWALNGLFPTPELAEKEVRIAKQFNLNTLNFHRNLGKEDVLTVQDRLGLMRCLEPGGGSQAISSSDGKPPGTAQRYMEAKIAGMIRAFRSHPSVIHYILQNEARIDPASPGLAHIFNRMHQEDPSRSIVGNDGFVLRSPQAWMQAYSDEIHKSGEHATPEGGAGGWWVDHSGHFSDVWQDTYYNSPTDFYFRTQDKSEIVEWGEIKGAAALDNHATLIEQIRKHGGKSYDLADHQEMLAAYEKFLDRWGFRQAFPTASQLFFSIGRRAYESWGQFMENVRICDENDMAVISGWESTAMENHSGIVDNFRDFKSDPRAIAESLQTVRPIAKQRHLVMKAGDRAVFDLYLLNDSNAPVPGKLTLTLTDPKGNEKTIDSFDVPRFERDRLSYLVREAVASEPLAMPGTWRSRLKLSGQPGLTHERELLVVMPAPAGMRPLQVAMDGLSEKVKGHLQAIPNVTLEAFAPGRRYDAIVCSGGSVEASKNLAVDAEGAYKPGAGPLVESLLSDQILAAVKAGTPLLAITPTDGQSVGVAKQLAAAGAFRFNGMVGPSRASWMGSWYFVRKHPLYDGLPVDQAMSIYYQAKAGGSNGWIVEGNGVEIVAAYSRDHDRNIGAGTFTAKLGASRIVMHRILEMHPVFAQRFLANALAYLAG